MAVVGPWPGLRRPAPFRRGDGGGRRRRRRCGRDRSRADRVPPLGMAGPRAARRAVRTGELLGPWWSLVLRDAGEGEVPRRAVVVDVPAVRHADEAGVVDGGAGEDAERRNRYRLLDRFGNREDNLAVPGREARAGLGALPAVPPRALPAVPRRETTQPRAGSSCPVGPSARNAFGRGSVPGPALWRLKGSSPRKHSSARSAPTGLAFARPGPGREHSSASNAGRAGLSSGREHSSARSARRRGARGGGDGLRFSLGSRLCEERAAAAVTGPLAAAPCLPLPGAFAPRSRRSPLGGAARGRPGGPARRGDA